ncbi:MULTISPECIES: porin family protein [unclassified Paraburkholderia]|uniref:hypothetical protein n=1 Tax=unclassified Paraburkholderia TaxID=2615204 RepID=UPI0038B76D18
MLLGGCTWYHCEPLSPQDTSTSASSLERVQIDPFTMPLPDLVTHRFDPSDGLDIDEVAMLAVANNPDLKRSRDDLGIAWAQAYSAGLLPDAQLSVSSDYPGATRAFNYRLSIDVMAQRAAQRESASLTNSTAGLGVVTNTGGAVDRSTASTSADAALTAGHQRIFGGGLNYTFGSAKIGFVITDSKLDNATGFTSGTAALSLANSAYVHFTNYEVNAHYTVTPALTLGVAYTYTDGKFSNARTQYRRSGARSACRRITTCRSARTCTRSPTGHT